MDEATRKVGGSEPEARSSPGLGAGNPLGTGNPWRCGLKAPEDPLEAAPSQPAQEACEAYLDYLREAPYSKENFVKGAQLGTQLLRAAGGWEEASRTLRRTWVRRNGDHFEQLHGNFFEGLVSEELLAKARENARRGIEAHYSGGTGKRVQSMP